MPRRAYRILTAILGIALFAAAGPALADIQKRVAALNKTFAESNRISPYKGVVDPDKPDDVFFVFDSASSIAVEKVQGRSKVTLKTLYFEADPSDVAAWRPIYDGTTRTTRKGEGVAARYVFFADQIDAQKLKATREEWGTEEASGEPVQGYSLTVVCLSGKCLDVRDVVFDVPANKVTEDETKQYDNIEFSFTAQEQEALAVIALLKELAGKRDAFDPFGGEPSSPPQDR